MEKPALTQFIDNLKSVPDAARRAFLKNGLPESERERSQMSFHNFFLHMQSVRTHKHSLRWTYTLGLGIIATAALIILTATGVLLMVYYKPSTELAYYSMKDINYVVFGGRIVRNVHRWAAHLMVVAALLHMARVFYTGSYRRPREVNWLIGLGLLVMTLALSFTGYILPWDQLGYWAATIGANIAQSPREVTDAFGITHAVDVGGLGKQMLLGASFVGEDALLRFYVLHCVVLPGLLMTLLGLHFWRIRKDGGLSRPESVDKPGAPDYKPVQPGIFKPGTEKTYGLMALVKGSKPTVGTAPENTVMSWPHLMYAEAAVFALTMAITLVLGYFLNAPLKEIANPMVPENPAKAPWYFLGLQELVSYSAFMGGIGIPTITLVSLALIPFLDRKGSDVGIWFGGAAGKKVFWQSVLFGAMVTVGMLALTITQGWLRTWIPNIPQLVITVVNPGTVLVGLYAWWSLSNIKRHNSIRMGAVAMFTVFLVGFILLTYVAAIHRGPNWHFYWLHSQWPPH
ncbi:MAG: cytochrome b N-terminal domain-containing protein [Armatimonadota bacterium]|nr:cytochrome b N-terminal domain-containing protein [Armatimonadota bacterium]